MTGTSDHPEFPLEIVHLNHAAVGPWPRRTVAAVERFARDNLACGSSHYGKWLEAEQALRETLRRLVNAASADDIALLKSTSEALSVVAYGIDWRVGDNVVFGRQEFPSNRVVWESLAPRFGVETRRIDLYGAVPSEEALLQAIDGSTRLLSVSSVQYDTGYRMDLRRLGEVCRDRGVVFCVDAIQSVGAFPLDVREIHADFAMADGHKWMLGPEGLALFYCSPEWRSRLTLNQFGWHMLAGQQDYESLDWAPAADARRFECGSPNMIAAHALLASLSLLEETGIPDVARAITANVSFLYSELLALGVEMVTPADPEKRAGIVTFRSPGDDGTALYRHLMSQGILCARRGGGIRLSPHFHTSRQAMARALERIRDRLK
ncbi:MAG: aminotransferase class V-fold PLP-dependent enzyme [Gammaproteobacteria bacterium]|jgi:selenocysteine lyase/cysteine desulfurase|nr:aminotransferase class V-fold PLP-dependent enzyme [Gammaproteobacteria bacterium]